MGVEGRERFVRPGKGRRRNRVKRRAAGSERTPFSRQPLAQYAARLILNLTIALNIERFPFNVTAVWRNAVEAWCLLSWAS